MPNRDTVKRAMRAIKRVADYEYFFEQLSSPAWIAPLNEEGLFRDPSPPIREGDYIRFPVWPQSKYLARMASTDPDAVLRVALTIGNTENVRIHEDLADAALAMPVPLAVKLVPFIVRWVDSPYQLLLPEKAADLACRLAVGGEVQSALRLTHAILDFRLVTPAQDDGAGWKARPVLRPKFNDYYYEEIVQRCVPTLAAAGGESVVWMLAGLLESALAHLYPNTVGREDNSIVWRKGIEEVEGIHRGDVESELVTAVRDAAEVVIKQSPDSFERIIRDLDKRRWVIFQRLAVHLVRVFASTFPLQVRSYLFDSSKLKDLLLHHEMWMLAHDGFKHLGPAEQEGYLELVRSIEMAQDYEEEDAGHWPPDRRRRYYLYRRLGAVAADLPGEWRYLYQELETEFGKLDHPSYLYYMTAWTGPTSPKKTEDLSSMPVDKLIDFLGSWQAPTEERDHSREGLGRALSASVESVPERYAPEAMRFQSLDPTYVSGLLTGLYGALRQKRSFSWKAVLELCAWVVSQPREIPNRKSRYSDLDPGWVWTRKAIADLLSAGLDSGPGTIPFEFRTMVWQTLEPLTTDPDPTAEQESRQGGVDAASLSINSVRGEAMHAVVRYGLWVRRHLTASAPDYKTQGFQEAPEVRAVLEAHLDTALETSTAIRSVYGQWLPWLLLLDSDWTKAALPRIFPREGSLTHLREAVWDGFVCFGGVFDNVFDVLRDEYVGAIERIDSESGSARDPDRPDSRLAEHLMVHYWRGRITIDERDGMLRRFYLKAPPSLRAHALDFVGRTLERDHDVPAEVIARLQELWMWRVQETGGFALPQKEAELREFGLWFASGVFPPDWAQEQLTTVLISVRKVEGAHLVLERLAGLSQHEPYRAIQILDLMVGVDQQGFSYRMEEVSTVLLRAIESSDARAREKAVILIHVFGARGLRDYADLLPQN